MPSLQTESTFVSFPDRDGVLDKLRAMDGSKPEHEPLFRLAAERLAHKAYDRSAFVFILIELIYEFKEIYGGPMTDLLARSVLALTRDSELAQSALDAYVEINASLEGEVEEKAAGEAGPETETDSPETDSPETETDETAAPVLVPDSPEVDPLLMEEAFPAPETESLEAYLPRAKGPEQERLMKGLQEAQKQVSDQGLSTRMAIDMTLSRPNREDVSHTLREIVTLRAALRGFDALLAEAEERILEEIGVLERD